MAIEEYKELSLRNKFYTLLDSVRAYSVATALRGPDFEADSLKSIFTQRLRALVMPHFLPPTIRTNSNILPGDLQGALEETVKQCKHNPFGMYHYLTHILNALNVLHEEKILEEEEYKCLMWLANFLLRILNLYTCKFVDETEINMLALGAEQYIVWLEMSKYIVDGEATTKAMRNILKSAKRYALKQLKNGRIER